MRSFLDVFSFYGRSKRSAYWIYFLVSIVGGIVLSLIFDLVIFRFNFFGVLDNVGKQTPQAVPVLEKLQHLPAALCIAVGVVGAFLIIGLGLAWLAISVRRLHDMGITGWLVLIFVLISLIGNILGYLISTLVLGIWPSSRKNRYGTGLRDGREVVGVFDDRQAAGTS